MRAARERAFGHADAGGSFLSLSFRIYFASMRIGLMIGGEGGGLEATLERFVAAERDGFASAWTPNIFGYDALTVLALAGLRTSRIELGTAVVPTYPRHPHALAQQAATVNAAIGGRLALGLGRSHQLVIEGMFGIPYEKPITHMREYLTIVRDLITKGSCSLDGKMYRVNANLSVPESKPFPILIGALMPKMLELCGRLCDGTLTWMSGPRHVGENIVPALRKASEAAGRAMPRVVCSLPVCVTNDVEGARKQAEQLFGHYGMLPVYRACLDAEGAQGPVDVALIGDETTVEKGLQRLAASAGERCRDGQPQDVEKCAERKAPQRESPERFRKRIEKRRVTRKPHRHRDKLVAIARRCFTHKIKSPHLARPRALHGTLEVLSTEILESIEHVKCVVYPEAGPRCRTMRKHVRRTNFSIPVLPHDPVEARGRRFTRHHAGETIDLNPVQPHTSQG